MSDIGQPRCGDCGCWSTPDESLVHTEYGEVPLIFYKCTNPRCITNQPSKLIDRNLKEIREGIKKQFPWVDLSQVKHKKR